MFIAFTNRIGYSLSYGMIAGYLVFVPFLRHRLFVTSYPVGYLDNFLLTPVFRVLISEPTFGVCQEEENQQRSLSSHPFLFGRNIVTTSCCHERRSLVDGSSL